MALPGPNGFQVSLDLSGLNGLQVSLFQRALLQVVGACVVLQGWQQESMVHGKQLSGKGLLRKSRGGTWLVLGTKLLGWPIVPLRTYNDLVLSKGLTREYKQQG